MRPNIVKSLYSTCNFKVHPSVENQNMVDFDTMNISAIADCEKDYDLYRLLSRNSTVLCFIPFYSSMNIQFLHQSGEG